MDIFNRVNMRGNRIEDCPDLDIAQKEIEFKEAEKRENISSKEKVPVIFGKIARWFTDLGSHLEDRIIHVSKNEREKWDKATQVSVSRSLTTGTKVGTITIDGRDYDLYCETNTDTNTDTKNTAGSTNSNSKLFLVGAATQAENSKTYSRNSAYVGEDGCLYSNNAKTLTVGDISQSAAVTTAGQRALDAREKNAAIEGTLANLIQQTNSNLITKTDRIINGINYDASSARTYQLSFDATYLVTCFPVSNDNINHNLTTIAIVQTGRTNGKGGQIIILYQTNGADIEDKDAVFLTLGNDGILTINNGYRYMHYSITKL